MKSILTIIFIFILFVSLTSPGIIDFPADTSTTQDGVNSSVDGDSAIVAEGDYYENIIFKGKAITIASQSCFAGNDFLLKTFEWKAP
jgi:hypothetical protein